MGFLSNKSVNYLNLHNGCIELMTQVVFLFGSLFLYQHGFTISQVLFTLGGMSLGRIITRFLALPLIKHLGLRKTIAIGIIGYGIAILMLSQVQGIDGWFIAYLGFYIFFNPIYWVCFHIYYTLVSEERHRGKQYAVRSAIILSGQALFPLIGAAIIKWLGYSWYFAIAIPITFAALFFLLLCPHAEVPRKSWTWTHRQLLSVGSRTSIFRSFYDLSCNTLWMFAMFQFFGGKMMEFGSVVTFGILIQILWQLAIGHRLDKGHADRIANIGGTLMLGTILSRVFMPLSLPVILAMEIINAIARLHISSVIDIATYNDSHRAEHIVWYWVFTEMTRDIGSLTGTWTAALLLSIGFDPREAILMALPALLMLWGILIHLASGRLPDIIHKLMPHVDLLPEQN